MQVAPGEMVALLGRNGCGKSTLLRCLSGVLPPRAGTVRLQGTPLDQLARKKVAQDPGRGRPGTGGPLCLLGA